MTPPCDKMTPPQKDLYEMLETWHSAYYDWIVQYVKHEINATESMCTKSLVYMPDHSPGSGEGPDHPF